MKKLFSLILFASVCLLMAGCKKNNPPPQQGYTGPINSVQILQVSYTQHTFLGGKNIAFNSAVTAPDSIPCQVQYTSPVDFGGITLTQIPSNDTFFSATIIWSGEGNINYPAVFDQPSSFQQLDTAVAFPDSAVFQNLFPRGGKVSNADCMTVWTAISKLAVTTNMMQKGCKIGILEYTPGVGIGDPTKWSWIVFLYI